MEDSSNYYSHYTDMYNYQNTRRKLYNDICWMDLGKIQPRKSTIILGSVPTNMGGHNPSTLGKD
jgi:hypothetical protein